MTAQFIGVGVGPGDPELITLKAARIIKSADVISYIANEDSNSQAKKIACDVLAEVQREQEEIAVIMPMIEDRSRANTVYDQAAINIQAAINKGQQVVFLCEGDPLFFGSFAYLLERLQENNRCLVVPGISSIHAASSALQLPLAMLKESFTVASGRHSLQQLEETLNRNDSVVIMKAGRSRQKILDALIASKRIDEAHYLEYIGRDGEYIQHDVAQLKGEAGPYFSLFVVTRRIRER